MASASTSNRKRNCVVLTISDKLKICQLVKDGRTLQSVADKYNVGKSTVHDIVKSEEKLQAFQKEIKDGDCIKKRKTVKKADLLALDKAVYLWFVQQRCKGECGACLVLWMHLLPTCICAQELRSVDHY